MNVRHNSMIDHAAFKTYKCSQINANCKILTSAAAARFAEAFELRPMSPFVSTTLAFSTAKILTFTYRHKIATYKHSNPVNVATVRS